MKRPARWSERGLAVVTLMAVAIVAGCGSPLDDDLYLDMQTSMERLRSIDPIQLEDRATVSPVTVDEAVAQAMERATAFATGDADRESVELALADVRAAALVNNLDLQVELFTPSIAQADLDAERAKFESVFTASIQRQSFDSPTSVATSGSRVEIDSYRAGVRVPLRTGGTINLDFPISETETNNPFSTLNPAVDADARFSISQPLLRNAGMMVNTHSIRVAQYQYQISGARTRLEAIRILANADRAYWRLYAAQQELEVRVLQYQRAVEQVRRAERELRAGAAAEVEVIRAQSGMANSLEGIIVASNAVLRLTRDLKRIMNRPDLPMTADTQLVLNTEPRPLGITLPVDELAMTAVANRMEMLELELQIAIDTSTVDLQRNARLPLVTLDYSYNINGLAGNVGNALDQIPKHSFEDWSIGLSAEIPIGNERAKAGVHRAILQRLQRLSRKEQRETAIRQEVYDAVDQLQQAWQRIIAARQEVLLNGRTYEAEQRQFDVGQRTSTDVLESAANLADAQSREARALSDYQIAQIDLAFATGTLLGHHQIIWDPTDTERDE